MRLPPKSAVAVGAVALSLALVSCGGDDSEGGDPAKGGAGMDESGSGTGEAGTGTGPVAIKDFKFVPRETKTKAGAKLRFANEDSAGHTATSDEGGVFDTGRLARGQAKAVTLAEPGTIRYHCDFHPFMKGTIVVE